MRPVCLECQTHEFNCDWNGKASADFLFRSENAYADGTARRPRGPGKRIDDLTESYPQDLRLNSANANVIPSDLIGHDGTQQHIERQLQQPLIDCALIKWSGSVAQRGSVLSAEDQTMDVEGFLALYNETLKSVQLRPVLELAYSAVALIYFGRTENSHQAILTSHECYQRVLKQMHAPVHSTNGRPSDELILTAVFLSSYEDRSGGFTTGSPIPNSFKHNDGAAALVEQRAGGPNRTKQSMLLDTIVRRRYIRSTINKFECIVPGLRDSSKFLEPLFTRMFHEYMVELADLQWQMLDMFKNGSSIESIIEVLLATQSLDLRMDESYQDCPTYAIRIGFGKYAVPAISRLADEVGVTYRFASQEDAIMWMAYQASRVRVKNIIVQLSRKAILHPKTCKDDLQCVLEISERKLDTLARDIFSAVLSYFETYVVGSNPAQGENYLLQNTSLVVAGKLIFSLHALGSCIAVPVKHKRLARDVLMLVARIQCNAVLSELYARGGIFSIPDETESLVPIG